MMLLERLSHAPHHFSLVFGDDAARAQRAAQWCYHYPSNYSILGVVGDWGIQGTSHSRTTGG